MRKRTGMSIPEILELLNCPNCNKQSLMVYDKGKQHCQLCGYMKTKTKEAKITNVRYGSTV